jgi:hypothetical protein
MKYRVEWLESAEEELAAVWLRSAYRRELTLSSATLDRMLEYDAHEIGESREPGIRFINLWPIGINFSADEATRVVKVVHVWEYRRRP